MRVSEQKIWEFYLEVLRELGIEDKTYHSGDEENIFDEAFKNAFGFWPTDDED